MVCSHRDITEWLWLEGIAGGHLVEPLCSKGWITYFNITSVAVARCLLHYRDGEKTHQNQLLPSAVFFPDFMVLSIYFSCSMQEAVL